MPASPCLTWVAPLLRGRRGSCDPSHEVNHAGSLPRARRRGGCFDAFPRSAGHIGTASEDGPGLGSMARRPLGGDMASRPTVTVIVPCYNFGDFLAECVQSVINQ